MSEEKYSWFKTNIPDEKEALQHSIDSVLIAREQEMSEQIMMRITKIRDDIDQIDQALTHKITRDGLQQESYDIKKLRERLKIDLVSLEKEIEKDIGDSQEDQPILTKLETTEHSLGITLSIIAKNGRVDDEEAKVWESLKRDLMQELDILEHSFKKRDDTN